VSEREGGSEMQDTEALTKKFQGTKVRTPDGIKVIESFGSKLNSVDEETLLINFTDGTWDWAEATEPIR
jgi:hypothetical protein